MWIRQSTITISLLSIHNIFLVSDLCLRQAWKIFELSAVLVFQIWNISVMSYWIGVYWSFYSYQHIYCQCIYSGMPGFCSATFDCLLMPHGLFFIHREWLSNTTCACYLASSVVLWQWFAINSQINTFSELLKLTQASIILCTVQRNYFEQIMNIESWPKN